MRAGFADGGDIFLLIGLEIGRFQKLRHAQKAIDRRAQFMRHGGEHQPRGAVQCLRIILFQACLVRHDRCLRTNKSEQSLILRALRDF